MLFYRLQDSRVLVAGFRQGISIMVLLLVGQSLEERARRPPLTENRLCGKGFAQLTLRGIDALPMSFKHRLTRDVRQHGPDALQRFRQDEALAIINNDGCR